MKRTGLIFLTCLIPGLAQAIGFDVNEPKTIKADKIEYNVKSESIKTSGNTEITNASGQRLTLTDSYLSNKGENLSGDDIKMWLGQHIYVESDNITRDGQITIAKDALFTACADCDPWGNAWEISATRIVHDMDERMVYFYNPVLWTTYVPVLWLPYFSFPDPGVKHKTGFLMPDLQSTNQMGTQINVPFYIYIAENQDLTLKLSYLTQENPLFQAEHRLNMEHSEFRTRGAYTHNKAGENRWYVFNNDVIELGEYARASVYLERTSDRTFLQKYGFYDDQPYLDSGAKLELFGQSSYVVADTHVFQELRRRMRNRASPDGDILPNIRAVHQTDPWFYETYSVFNADILGISGKDNSSQRMIGDMRIISPWTLWGGNRLTLSADARYDIYHFNNTVMIDEQAYTGMKNRFLPSGSVEWALPFMRPGENWTQIIEPRARLTIMRTTDDVVFPRNNDSGGAFLSDITLFSENRFPGLDLWENGTYSDYGARWAAFDNTGKSIEVFLGQSYDFTKRENIDPNSGFHNGASDYVGRVGLSTGNMIDFYSRFRLDQTDLGLNHIETSARIGTSNNYLDVGHIWSQQFIDTYTVNDTINEIMAGAGIQLSDRWSTRFRAIYNITYEQFQRHFGGLYYNHPCYYLAFEYRRDNAIKEDYVGTTTYQFRFGMSIDGKHY